MIDNRMKSVRAKPKAIWYAWFPGDYASKTATLTLVEHGAYRVLLDHYYEMHGSMVANATLLLRVCRAFDSAEIAAVHSVLAKYFVERDGYYHHERADAELAKRAMLREKRAAAGSKGGKQKVANATNLLEPLPDVCQTQQQLQQQPKKEENHLESDSSSKRVGDVASDPAPASFGKKPSKKKNNGIEVGIPTDDVGAIVDYWNGLAEHVGLPQVRMVTATRRQKVQARINELGGVVNLGSVIDKIEHQPFLLGKNKRNWQATFDWVMEPSNLAKVAENTYANTGGVNGHA